MTARNSSDTGYQRILKNNLGVIFLGTPHGGFDSTALLRLLRYARETGEIQAGLLKETNLVPSLQRILRHFEGLCTSNELNVKTVSFYEELEVPQFGLVSIVCLGTIRMNLTIAGR